MHERLIRGQPVEKPLHAALRGSNTPPLQCFGLDVWVFGCGFGLSAGSITTFSTRWGVLRTSPVQRSRKSGHFRQGPTLRAGPSDPASYKGSLSKSGFVVLTNGLLQLGKVGGV